MPSAGTGSRQPPGNSRSPPPQGRHLLYINHRFCELSWPCRAEDPSPVPAGTRGCSGTGAILASARGSPPDRSGISNYFSEHGRRVCAPWRPKIPPFDKRSAKSFVRTNERIRAREVRVIDENGEQLGVMPPFEALKMARERSLDLVEISPNAVPPVCKIQDYGKYLYEKDKSERAARKKQKVITLKEVKFSVTVDEHDYQTKKNQAIRFLGDGDKVKASLRFKGRQMAHRDLGYKIINRLIMDIGEAGMVEFMPRMEGTTLHAILAPARKTESAPAASKPKPTLEAPGA